MNSNLLARATGFQSLVVRPWWRARRNATGLAGRQYRRSRILDGGCSNTNLITLEEDVASMLRALRAEVLRNIEQ
jgi:hypothetical protein